MSPVTFYLAKLIGAVCCVMGAMLLTRRAEATALARRLLDDPGIVALSGAIRTVLGLAMVIGHEEWSSPVAAAVSFFGWILLLSGLLLLFAERRALQRRVGALMLERRLPIYATVLTAVGLLYLGAGIVGER
jgi:hypothetical protein